MSAAQENIKQKTHRILADGSSSKLGRAVSLALIILILLNVAAVMAESVDSIQSRYSREFYWFEVLSVTVFVIEYLLRLWSCTADPRYAQPVSGRARFAMTPLAMIDLLAVLPTLILWTGVDLRFLRILRLSRLLRLAKLGRYTNALQTMGQVISSKREELLLALMLMLMILVVASSLMYMAEHDQQPEAFSSIPATLWWGIMTLTTVGYGDVYPVTVLGKITAAVIAVAGIGLFALPAGIIGSGFVEMKAHHKRSAENICPHCGKSIKEPPEDT